VNTCKKDNDYDDVSITELVLLVPVLLTNYAVKQRALLGDIY
jgi:hypothetical protein